MAKSFASTYVCDADHDATYHFDFRIGLGAVHAGFFLLFGLGVWS